MLHFPSYIWPVKSDTVLVQGLGLGLTLTCTSWRYFNAKGLCLTGRTSCHLPPDPLYGSPRLRNRFIHGGVSLLLLTVRLVLVFSTVSLLDYLRSYLRLPFEPWLSPVHCSCPLDICGGSDRSGPRLHRFKDQLIRSRSRTGADPGGGVSGPPVMSVEHR